MSFPINEEFLEDLKQSLAEKNDDAVRNKIKGMRAVDISQLLYLFNTEDSKYIIDLVDIKTQSKIINNIDEYTRRDFLKEFSAERIALFLEYIDSDDCVDILIEQEQIFMNEIISFIHNEEKANNIRELLHYPSDSAGGIMAKELIKVHYDWTVGQCVEEIKKQAQWVRKFYSVYVVDSYGKLLGRVSPKRILISDHAHKIENIYNKHVHYVEAKHDQKHVADIMQKYNLEVIPVINAHKKLIGMITIDDIVDVITEIAETQRNLMAGYSESVSEQHSVWKLTKARLPWLFIGTAGGLLGAKFISLFEQELMLIPAIAFFIPLITATGGNVGIQSSSIVVQNITKAMIFREKITLKLRKTMLISFLNGLVISSVVFASIYTLYSDLFLALTVGISLFVVIILSSVMGTITPILLNKIKLNPALASGPFITTINDLLGLTVYFIVALFLHNYFAF